MNYDEPSSKAKKTKEKVTNKIKKGGQWVMIARKLPCEINPPLLSCFFAKPVRKVSEDRLIRDENIKLNSIHKARENNRNNIELEDGIDVVQILTESGNVSLLPGEYLPISDSRMGELLNCCDDNHATLHELSYKTPMKVRDIRYYAVSREIPRNVAYGWQ